MKWIIAVFLTCKSLLVNAENACVREMINFGENYNSDSIESKGKKQVATEPNTYGEKGDLVYLTTYTLDSNWVKMAECSTCSPKKSVIELFLLANRNLPCGLKENFSSSEVIKKLGKPDERADSQLTYSYPPLERTEFVSFNFEKDKLKSVHWVSSID